MGGQAAPFLKLRVGLANVAERPTQGQGPYTPA